MDNKENNNLVDSSVDVISGYDSNIANEVVLQFSQLTLNENCVKEVLNELISNAFDMIERIQISKPILNSVIDVKDSEIPQLCVEVVEENKFQEPDVSVVNTPNSPKLNGGVENVEAHELGDLATKNETEPDTGLSLQTIEPIAVINKSEVAAVETISFKHSEEAVQSDEPLAAITLSSIEVDATEQNTDQGLKEKIDPILPDELKLGADPLRQAVEAQPNGEIATTDVISAATHEIFAEENVGNITVLEVKQLQNEDIKCNPSLVPENPAAEINDKIIVLLENKLNNEDIQYNSSVVSENLAANINDNVVHNGEIAATDVISLATHEIVAEDNVGNITVLEAKQLQNEDIKCNPSPVPENPAAEINDNIIVPLENKLNNEDIQYNSSVVSENPAANINDNVVHMFVRGLTDKNAIPVSEAAQISNADDISNLQSPKLDHIDEKCNQKEASNISDKPILSVGLNITLQNNGSCNSPTTFSTNKNSIINTNIDNGGVKLETGPAENNNTEILGLEGGEKVLPDLVNKVEDKIINKKHVAHNQVSPVGNYASPKQSVASSGVGDHYESKSPLQTIMPVDEIREVGNGNGDGISAPLLFLDSETPAPVNLNQEKKSISIEKLLNISMEVNPQSDAKRDSNLISFMNSNPDHTNMKPKDAVSNIVETKNEPVKKPTLYRESFYKLFDPLYQPTPVNNTPDAAACLNELTLTNAEIFNMDDISDEKMKLEQQLCDLKLELNQVQQDRSLLELELHQKDEVILKMQGEAQKKDGGYKHDIKLLQDKLNMVHEQNNNEEVKILKDENSSLKEQVLQLNDRILESNKEAQVFKETLEEYEGFISTKVSDNDKLQVEYETAKQHLTALEMAFSDIHTKYERCKGIVAGYKTNEDTMVASLEKSNALARKYEERYEALKAHAKAQLEKANKELLGARDKHQGDISKLTTIIKRLEIKNGSVQQALDQKTKECSELSALCDELTGATPK